MVGEGVDEDGGVLARLDDFVEVADGAGLHRARERSVDPAGRLAFEQVAADEVAAVRSSWQATVTMGRPA